MTLSNEAKVGGLVFLTAALLLGFGWFLGMSNPFSQGHSYYVTYHFAGGIEVGSPVRVSGIKVGKVEKIEFFKPVDAKTIAFQEPGSDILEDGKVIAPVKLKISVHKDAAVGIRKDSRFYINIAGIIGERYVEITPGHFNTPALQTGETIAGIDPPRVDQLLSQSFDLAGKIKDIIDENKGDLTRSVELLYKLSGNLNKTLAWVDKSAVFKTDLSQLVDNLITITGDIKTITKRVHTPEGEKTLQLLYQLLWRLEPLNSKVIQDFLQKEGVKVHLF